MGRCVETKSDGDRCGIDFGICEKCRKCFHHCEHRAEEAAAARKKGGDSTAKKLRGGGLDPEELPPLETHRDAKAWLETAGRAVATGRLSDRSGNVVVRAVSEWVKAHEGELTAHVVEDLKAEVERLKGEIDGREPWR